MFMWIEKESWLVKNNCSGGLGITRYYERLLILAGKNMA